MGIYQRDNINYGGMLGNAMQNRARQIERDYENYMKQPTAWANAVQQSGQAVSDALNKYAYTKWGYDQDMNKLGVQQDFQKDMKEMELREALKRAREQQNWQSAENDLQRKSNERMAEINHNAGIVKQAEEKQIKNKLDYDLAKSMLPLIDEKLKYVENPSDKITLQAQRVKYQSAIDNYENLYGKPEPNPLEFSQEFLNEATGAQPASTSDTPMADWLGTFDSGYKNYKTNALAANKAIRDDLKAKLADENFKNALTQNYGTAKVTELNKALTDLDTHIKKVEKIEANYQAELKGAGDNYAKIKKIKAKYGRK